MHELHQESFVLSYHLRVQEAHISWYSVGKRMKQKSYIEGIYDSQEQAPFLSIYA